MTHRALMAGLGVAVATTLFGSAPVVAGGAAAASAVAVHPLISHERTVGGVRPPTTAQCVKLFGLPCYSPFQMRTAYNLEPLYSAGLTGRGRTIGIVDAFGSPTIRQDLAAFDRAFGIADPPSFTIVQPAGQVPPYDPNNSDMRGWAAETTLDVEWAHAIAPGARIVLAETPVSETEGVTGFPEIVTAENYLIDNHLVDVITQSFGATEQTFPSKQSLLNLRSAILNAFHHNVSVLASTGDTGAANYQLNLTDLYTHPVVGWPATDPLVTAVGGTQLHLNQQGRRTAPDNAWNDTVLFGFPTAGGGGLSTIFSRPGYQDSVANVVDGHRGIPDISMSAACNGAVEYFHTYGGATPGWHIVCGTSEASPLFSGVVAIADQAAGHDLGLLNPRLYALGTASAGIVDVTRGSITVTFTQNGSTFTVGGPRFNAKPGYDLATGLGTVDATRLVAELAR